VDRYTLLSWKRFRTTGATATAATPDAAVIGAGAMGRVLLAMDEEMGRVVAIKEMHAAAGEIPRRVRFTREARVTGALEHPGIVPVHEIGERADGAPYYTMRLVRGRSLADAIDGADGLRGRLALLPHVVDLCHAIAFAHSQGVIHRDLKPENVMVGEFGETVALDWGLASGLAADPVPGATPSRASLARATSPSRTAGIMGTPAFMSPEQAWGRPGEVDEASDVWALGAILYQLLTGTLPVPGETANETLDWLRDDRNRVESVRSRCREAPRELASVAMACLQRRKAERMPSAQHMAREIERWQAGERVVSHRYSIWELLSHVVNRNRPLSVAVAVAGLVAAAAVGQGLLARQARLDAEAVRRQHAFEQLLLAREALDDQRPLEAEARLKASLEQHDTLLARALWARIQATPLLLREQLATEITGLAFTPDDQRIALASASPDLLLIDGWTGARETLPGPGRNLYVVAWSPDGRTLAAGSGAGEVVLWPEPGADPVILEGHGDIVSALAFERGGRRLLSGSFDGTARLWSLDDRSELQRFEGHEGLITAVAWGPGDATVATASADRTVRTWSVASGEPVSVMTGHESEVTGLAYLDGGASLVSASYDGSLRSWDPGTGEALGVREDPSAQYTILKTSGDGRVLAAGDDQGRLHLWSPPSAEAALVIPGQRSLILSLALDADGGRVAAGGVDRALELWNAATAGLGLGGQGHTDAVTAVDQFPDGERLASAGWDGRVISWDARTGRPLASWQAHGAIIESLRVAPDGETVATGAADMSVRLHDAETGRLEGLFTGHYGTVQGLAFHPDGGALASAWDAGMVYLWDLETGTGRVVLDERSPTAVAFGPAGDRLAVSWSDGGLGFVRVERAADGTPLFEASVEATELTNLAFTADGTLLSFTRGGEVLRWDRAGEGYTPDFALGGRALALRADPSGRWVAAGTTLGLRVQGEDGALVELTGHRGPVEDLAFDGAGTSLASAGMDGTVRTWDPTTGRPAWFGSALLPWAGLRAGHGGLVVLEGAEPEDLDSAWHRAVAERARLAEGVLNKQQACLLSWDGQLELWDRRQDQRVHSAEVASAQTLAAGEDGCAVLDAEGRVISLAADGSSAELPDRALAMDVYGGELLVAVEGAVRSYASSGTLWWGTDIPFDEPTVVASHRGGFAVGDRHGGVYGQDYYKDGTRGSFRLQDTPTAAVTALADAGWGVIAAGYADGTVGLWDEATGTRLLDRRLHGAVRFLEAHDEQLHVMTELGAYASIDLSVLSESRCVLLRDIWQRVPVCWDGAAQPCAPLRITPAWPYSPERRSPGRHDRRALRATWGSKGALPCSRSPRSPRC